MLFYEDETTKIYNQDCLEALKQLKDESVDLIVTDPPYLIDYKTKYRKSKEHKFCNAIANDYDNSKGQELIKACIKESFRILKKNSAMYMFCSSHKIDFFKKEIENYFKIKNIIIWVKNNHTAGDLKAQFARKYEMIILANKGRALINGKRLTDVWMFDRVAGNKQLHQNQKPEDIINQCIQKHSKEGDTVLDPFMGSGTTGMSCKKLNRNFIGIELMAEYCNIAKARMTKGEKS